MTISTEVGQDVRSAPPSCFEWFRDLEAGANLPHTPHERIYDVLRAPSARMFLQVPRSINNRYCTSQPNSCETQKIGK